MDMMTKMLSDGQFQFIGSLSVSIREMQNTHLTFAITVQTDVD